VVGVPDIADPGLGFCALLSAHERFHHAGISGAALQSPVCRVPGSDLDHRLHLTKISVQLYAASVVLERVAGWSLWKTAVVLVIATGIYTIAADSLPSSTPTRSRH